METRARQLGLRLVICAVSAPAFQVFVGWRIAAGWFVLYAALQFAERILFPPHLRASRLDNSGGRRLALAILFTNFMVYGGVGLLMFWFGGEFGRVSGQAFIAGALLNAVLTCSRSRAMFVAAVTPSIGYMFLLPPMALAAGASPAQTAPMALGAVFGLLGSISGWSLHHRVLAAETAARARAEQATEAKSAFVAMVSHDLRTPISAILAGAKTIEDHEARKAIRSSAALITSSARMMKILLDDLLDFSKIEAGRLDVDHEPLDIRALVLESVRFWRPEAARRGLRLRLEGAHQLPRGMLGDSVRLRQILNNLFSNALKFTPRGRVSLLIRRDRTDDGDRLILTVADTGAGIAPDDLSKLFGAFEQFGAQADRSGGTGLGLNISRKLARLMGGDLDCKSRLERGSAFTLTVPLVEAQTPDAFRPADDVGAPLAGVRVLVADDHPVNLQAFSLILEAVGARVTTAEDGLQAVAAASNSTFDVILLDLHMPLMGGLDAVRDIRANSGPNQTTPVLALTASVNDSDREACLHGGMDGFVRKPVEGVELMTAILEALADRREADGTPLADGASIDRTTRLVG